MKMFPQRYNKKAIGSQFGEKIFIQRCMCTVIGYGVTLNLDCKRKGLPSVGTHILECDFGVMRILQRFVNTVDSAINTAVKTSMIIYNNMELSIKQKINTRENNRGAKIDCEKIPTEEHIFFNVDLICNVIYKLMINAKINIDSFRTLIIQINEYTSRYIQSPTTKFRLKKQSSASPLSRYLTMYSLMSSVPIPQSDKINSHSPLDFYYGKSTDTKSKEKLNLWTSAVVEIKNLLSFGF